MIKQLLSLCAIAILATACSKVQLLKKSEYDLRVPSFVTGKGIICIPANYSLETFTVTNLNAVFKDGKLTSDSDHDGLGDDEEVVLGFDPLNDRSQGLIMDRLCLNTTAQNDCSTMDLQCDGRENDLGISDCDIKAAGLDNLYDHPDMGLDSDKDGIVDLLEIRAGGFPGVKDDTNDMDGDGVINREEYFQGSEIRRYDLDLESRYRTKVELSKLDGQQSEGCEGQSWSVDLNQLPLVTTQEYKDLKDRVRPGVKMSHGENGNIVLMVYKIRPDGGTGDSQVWYDFVEVFHSTSTEFQNMVIDGENFQLAGLVEP